ncbi:hypothetical protein [Methanoculleus chikugoensis]|uniref:hypothetical protein n=1 Tax=Methanoculleus chikugoensis TaxID=118126 RepID=UPI001FB25170|nr:hypothetical protein [Methanoculleus chikugoensis]
MLEIRASGIPWRRWGGPYLSERQWGGTVREDYGEDGNSWAYFTHDQARSRAYRWGGKTGLPASPTTPSASVLRSPSGTAPIPSSKNGSSV